jgi:hypothetical protein
MSEIALAALQRALRTQLEGSSPPWTGVWWHRAGVNAQEPYVVMYSAGGGPENVLHQGDDTHLIGVKALSRSYSQAMACAAEIRARLDNRGTQEPGGTLDGGTYWVITTSTEERTIDTPEYIDDAVTLWHVGAVYRFTMEEL